MKSNKLTSQKSAMQKSLLERLRSLRIKAFIDQLYKLTHTIIRESFMTVGNAQYSQTLAQQTNAKLNVLHSDIIQFCVAKIKGGWEKNVLS